MKTKIFKTLTIFMLILLSYGIAEAQDSTGVVAQKKIKPEYQLRALSDSLKKTRISLAEAQAQLQAQNKNIAELNKSLAAKDQSAAVLSGKVDEISVFGIPLSKSTYNLITAGIIFVIALALVIAIFVALKNLKEARYRINLFRELTEEFQAHKIKANEKEKKLARELQDVRNKMDDLGIR